MEIKVIDVKVPVKAPFFLPTVAGLDPTFDRSEKDEEPESKISSNSSPLVSLVSDVGRQLENYLESANQTRALMGFLKDLSPSKIDSEISALDPEGCCSEKPLLGLLNLLKDSFEEGLYWDAAQAMLKVALGKHFEQISKSEELLESVEASKQG